MNSSTARTLVLTYGASVVSLAAPILCIPLFNQILGKERWGLLAIALSIQAAAMALEAGLSQANIKLFADQFKTTRKISSQFYLAFRRTYGRMVLGSFPVCVLYAAYAFHRAGTGYLGNSGILSNALAVSASVAMVLIGSLQRSVFIGTGQLAKLSLVSAIFVALRYTVSVGVAWLTRDTFYVVMAQAALYAAENLCRNRMILDACTSDAPVQVHSSLDLVRIGGLFSLTVVIGSFALSLDRVFVTLHRPLEDIGVYQTLVTIAAGFQALITPFSLTLLPRILHQEPGSSSLNRLILLYVAFIGALWAVCAAVLQLFPALLFNFFHIASAEQDVAAAALLCIVTGQALNGLGEIYYSQWIRSSNYRWMIARNAALAAYACLALPMLVQRFGLVGAASLSIVNGILILTMGLLSGQLSRNAAV